MRGLGKSTLAEFGRLAKEQTGIDLPDAKGSLIEARIRPRMRALGLATPRAYLETVRSSASGERQEFIDAIATNVTSFFREPDHFERLFWFLRDRIKAGQSRLRLWSAACSTGQEPYSMAMVAADAAAETGAQVEILATDISARALREARSARYPAKAFEPLPSELRSAHVTMDAEGCGSLGPVRKLVKFSPINLVAPPYSVRGPFDVVFCRNVLIYFTRETKVRVLTALASTLAPDGLLFVAHAEGLAGLPVPLQPVCGSIFRPLR